MWCSSTLCHINFSGLNGRRKERKEKLEFHSFSSLRLARFVRIGRSVSPNKKGWVNLKLCVLQLCREDPAIYYTCIYVSTALAHSLTHTNYIAQLFVSPLCHQWMFSDVLRTRHHRPYSLSRCVYLAWLPVEKSFPCLSFVRSLCVLVPST